MSKLGDSPMNPIPHNGAITIGLTKREHFAGLALQGLIINRPKFCANDITRKLRLGNMAMTEAFRLSDDYLAALALEQADALLEALEEK